MFVELRTKEPLVTVLSTPPPAPAPRPVPFRRLVVFTGHPS